LAGLIPFDQPTKVYEGSPPNTCRSYIDDGDSWEPVLRDGDVDSGEDEGPTGEL
jgi:hypothetical protein